MLEPVMRQEELNVLLIIIGLVIIIKPVIIIIIIMVKLAIIIMVRLAIIIKLMDVIAIKEARLIKAIIKQQFIKEDFPS